jgi:hypothetical protein
MSEMEERGAAGVTETGHRPEVAIPVIQPLWIEAKADRRDGDEAIGGYAIAVGWDRPQKTTFYLVSDAKFARPLWISEDEVMSNSIRPLA